MGRTGHEPARLGLLSLTGIDAVPPREIRALNEKRPGVDLDALLSRALFSAPTAAKKGIKSERYEPIPYASEQGIFCGLAGNLNRRSGKFPPRSGNPALVRYLGPTGPTNPILPRDLERCREAKRDAARCSRSRGPRYAENRSPSTRRQARRSQAAPGRYGSGRAPGGIQRARTGVMPRKVNC